MKPKPRLSLEERALAYLTRREYSRAELRQKLLSHAEDEGLVDSLLDKLTARGALSDTRYVDQLLFARQAKFGRMKISYELRQKGIATPLIEEALQKLCATERERALAVWRRKFGTLPVDAEDRARQIRFMQARGFELDVILDLMRSIKN